MFYLPNGDGAQVAVNIPQAVLALADPGSSPVVAPGHLVLNAQGTTEVDVLWGTDQPGNWHPHVIDWNRDPVLIPIPVGADGNPAKAVKFRRKLGAKDPVLVTADFQP